MIALLSASRAIVDRPHALALDHGGSDDGKPGLHPAYHLLGYGACFRDPDGDKLCVCQHAPETTV